MNQRSGYMTRLAALAGSCSPMLTASSLEQGPADPTPAQVEAPLPSSSCPCFQWMKRFSRHGGSASTASEEDHINREIEAQMRTDPGSLQVTPTSSESSITLLDLKLVLSFLTRIDTLLLTQMAEEAGLDNLMASKPLDVGGLVELLDRWKEETESHRVDLARTSKPLLRKGLHDNFSLEELHQAFAASPSQAQNTSGPAFMSRTVSKFPLLEQPIARASMEGLYMSSSQVPDFSLVSSPSSSTARLERASHGRGNTPSSPGLSIASLSRQKQGASLSHLLAEIDAHLATCVALLQEVAPKPEKDAGERLGAAWREPIKRYTAFRASFQRYTAEHLQLFSPTPRSEEYPDMLLSELSALPQLPSEGSSFLPIIDRPSQELSHCPGQGHPRVPLQLTEASSNDKQGFVYLQEPSEMAGRELSDKGRASLSFL